MERAKMNKTILIVDDERFIRILLEEALALLESSGVRIVTARNGSEALQLALVEQPALVILDIMMPRMDGYEVCERIRREPTLRDTYIIMLTAKGQSGDKLRGLQVGANEYLTKPFDPSYLITRAQDLLGVQL